MYPHLQRRKWLYTGYRPAQNGAALSVSTPSNAEDTTATGGTVTPISQTKILSWSWFDPEENLLDGRLELTGITEEAQPSFTEIIEYLPPAIIARVEEGKDGENVEDIIDEEEQQQKQRVKLEKISVTYQSAIILTKRPSMTAGVLHELTRIAEQPSGIYRETALSIINEEFAQSKEKSVPIKDINSVKEFYPITPLSLSDTQQQVIKNIDNTKFIAVQGLSLIHISEPTRH